MKKSEFKQIIKEEVQVVLFERQLTEGKVSDFLSQIKAAAIEAARANYQDAIDHVNIDKLRTNPISPSLLNKAESEIETKSQSINEGFMDTIRNFSMKGLKTGIMGSVISGITALSAGAQYLETSFSKWYYSTIQGLADTEVTRIISDLYGAKAMGASAGMTEGSIWFKLGMYAFFVFFVIATLSFIGTKITKQKS